MRHKSRSLTILQKKYLLISTKWIYQEILLSLQVNGNVVDVAAVSRSVANILYKPIS